LIGRLPKLSLALALIPCAWDDAAGQDSATAQRRHAAIQALRLGQHVRIATPAGQYQGLLTRTDAGAVWITWDSAVTPVRLPEIERLWVRGRATRSGALIGAVAGAAIGAAAGLFIGTVVCNDPDCQANTAEAVAALGLGGGAAGALAGTIIGRTIPRWHQRFP
jgi:hypothetical protein